MEASQTGKKAWLLDRAVVYIRVFLVVDATVPPVRFLVP
jgi:hypothetical protein